MIIPLQWIGIFAVGAVFVVMFTLGLMLGREQIAAALARRVVLAAVIFAVVVPIPALAVLIVKVFQPHPAVAAGIILMAISPGAPVALRRWRPVLAQKLEPRLAKLGNLLLIGLGVMALVDLPSIIRHIGWLPSLAGFVMTFVALAVGAAFAWRDPEVRPAAAVAAAMRNPGLALMIASLNHAGPAVIAGIIGYAIGLGVAMVVFLQWRKRVVARVQSA